MCIQLKPLFSRHKGIGVQFTDEPTGNLDEETAMSIMQILEDSVHQMNKCAVIVTHSNEIPVAINSQPATSNNGTAPVAEAKNNAVEPVVLNTQ